MKKPEQHSKRSRPKVDRISQLPENVIDKILTKMTIAEAAKTAVLSENWKRGWRNISALEFGYCFSTKFEKADRRDLMLAICRILFLHLGGIDRFTLAIPWMESCAEINPLIQFLSEKKVKHLKIHLENRESHILPSYIFSCFQLTTLDLIGCVLNPPHSFGGFGQLVTLVLKHVDMSNDFGMFISNCPLLQQIRLEQCSFTEVSSINIIAPNLRTFFYMGCKLFICFVSAPLLDELVLYERDKLCFKISRQKFDRVKKLYLDKFCASLPSLRKLTVDYCFLKSLEVCNLSAEFPNCLLQLKDLSVKGVLFSYIEEVSSLIELIRSSPNLEKLSIGMEYSDADVLYEALGSEEYDFSCNKLETIELCEFNGTNAEMTFLESLLMKSPQLKEMIIDNVKEISSLVGFIRSSPNLERLEIVMQDNDYDTGIVLGPEKYDFSCNKLQTVELSEFKGSNAEMTFLKALLLKSPQLKEINILGVKVSSLVWLIRGSPNLERLTIWMLKNDDAVDAEGLEEYDFSCNTLQTVELHNFWGTNAEMTFVKDVLLKSPQLKKMTIRGASEDEELDILRKMIRFHRASIAVDINVCKWGE